MKNMDLRAYVIESSQCQTVMDELPYGFRETGYSCNMFSNVALTKFQDKRFVIISLALQLVTV